jgi:hypothetical protein
LVQQQTILLELAIHVPLTGSTVFFYPIVSLFFQDEHLLPVFDSECTHVVLLPGETNVRSIETPIPASIAPFLFSLGHEDDDISLTVEVSSWNGSPIRMQLDLRMDCIHADVKASRLTN